MATVGLSFGSATSGQGFNVASTVAAIQASEQAIETPWQTQLTALQAQDTVLTQLGTDLSTLTSSLQSLTDFTGVFSQMQGSSSNTNALALTSADSTATAGSHTVVINSLAQTSSEYSNAVANASDTLSGSITVQVGSGTAQTITVGSTSNTLQSLVTAINAAGAGVKATLVTDTTGTRLNLVSSTSGAAGQLTIGGSLTDATTGKAISFQAGQTGADASLSVDGIALTSASNTVTTAVPGVTMQLLAASTSPVQVEITNDTASVSTAFSTMVNAYNAVIKDVAGQEKNNASGQAQPLFGNPTLAMIQSQLSSVLFAGGASGSISNLSQLGISTNSDGTLALDTGTLTNALNANPTAVQGYFQNTSSFGSTLASVLNNLGTQAPSGAVYLAQQQNSKQEAALNADITQENALLATQKTQLTTELNQANQILQSIPSQLNQVNEIYSAITGYNQNRIG